MDYTELKQRTTAEAMTLNQRIELMLCAEESYIQQGIREGILRDFAELRTKLTAANIGADQHAKLLAFETAMRREACAEIDRLKMHIKHIGNDALRTQNQVLLEALKELYSNSLGTNSSGNYDMVMAKAAIKLAEGKDV